MNSKFSWALVISAIIASVFAYFAVMGGIYHYWYVGNLIKPLLWGLGLWISIVVSVKLMCCSKTYKSKKASRRLEWIVGCILFAVLWVGSIFFLNFWNIYADRKDISEEMKEVCKSAEALDKAYEKYVKKRIRNYGRNLELNRVDMDIPISEASLKRRILPDSLKTEVQKRHEWLASMEDVNVFNPITPFNIQKLENGFEESKRTDAIAASSIALFCSSMF